MDYDYVAAEQNLSAYGVVDGHHNHRGGEEDEYEEENQREDYYSEHGVGIHLGGGGGEMGPMDSIDDNGNAGLDLKHSMDDSAAGKLFVGGIAWETSEESFKRYFSKFGELTDSVIMMDKITGRPRGFGFVTYADAESANKALDVEHVLDGRTVEVKRTVPREDMQSRGGAVSRTKKIFIGGIPLSLSEDDLREYFSAYGNVLEHQIMLDHKTGRSRGFGFVTFDSEEAVEKIFVDGQMHELGGKQVEIKRAEPKRSGFDSSGGNLRRGGMNSKPYGAYGGSAGGADGFGGGYGGKMGRGGYGAGAGAGYGGFGPYGGYGNFPGNYGAGAAGFYGGGFGAYGYGFGFGGPMYGGAAGYGAGAYGNPAAAAAGGYGGGAAGYGGGGAAAGGRGYGAGYDGGKGYGVSGGGASGYRGSSSGGSGGSGGGGGSSGHGGSKGYRGASSGGGGSADGGRYHPYGRK